jgi:hypothetical protein
MKHIKNYSKYNEGIFSSIFKNKEPKEEISADDIVEYYLELTDCNQIKCSLKRKDKFFMYSTKYSELTAGFFDDEFSKMADDFINSNLKDLYKYNDELNHPSDSNGYYIFHIEFNKNDISVDEVLNLLQSSEDRLKDQVKQLVYFLGFNNVYKGETEGPEDRTEKITNMVKKKFKSTDELKIAIDKIEKSYSDYEKQFLKYYSIYIRIKP